MKGLGFLDGDDQKNAGLNFNRLNQYAGWYKADCDMMIVKRSSEKMPLAKACINALFQGIALLSNESHCGADKVQGCGMIRFPGIPCVKKGIKSLKCCGEAVNRRNLLYRICKGQRKLFRNK